MRRLAAMVIAIALAAAMWDGAAVAVDRDDLDAYRGLGTWVDVFDYVPAFQNAGSTASVTTRNFDDMARLGVKTVYLQAAQEDERSPRNTIDPKLLRRMLRAAHDADLSVVAWYLPRFIDVYADFRRVRALLDFEANGEEFDGFALDIEANRAVPVTAERNEALVDLSERIRDRADDRPVGAIVLEPVLLEEVNTDFWPEFPWRKLASLYDVWLPMSYWTNRNADSGYKEGFRYTDENIRRVRNNLDDKDAPVHAIGGIADTALAKDYEGFMWAVKRDDAIGWSVYDYSTTVTSSTSSPSAFATAWRLWATEASRSMTSAASGPAAIFSMYTHGPGSNIVPRSESAMTAMAFGRPRAVSVVPSIGSTAISQGGPPEPICSPL